MNKTIKTLLVAVMVVCLAVSAIALVACKDKTVTYTVNVTCNDTAALNNVKVQIKKADGTLVKEATPIDGKATFDLEGADYTATLTGVAEGYEFADGKLTADAPSCTITVTKKQTEPTGYTYTVNVTYPALLDVYGNTVDEEEPANGVTVSLYAGELEDDNDAALAGKTPAATKTTGADGKAVFQLEDELYTIVISGQKSDYRVYYPEGHFVLTVSKDSPTCEVTFRELARVGTMSSPLTFHLGTNTVPLTNDALRAAGGMGVVYAFTPEKTGNYTFTATGNAVIIPSDGFMPIIQNGGSAVVSLEEGKTYCYFCIANDTPETYTVTIAEGGELGGGEHDYPWEGEGTLANPYVITTLADSYSIYVEEPIYLTYTPTANETYTISSNDTNTYIDIFLMVTPKDEYDNGRIAFKNFNGKETNTLSFTLTAGETYWFSVDPYNYNVDVEFTITQQGTTPPQSPDGTIDHPFILDELVGDYHYVIADENSLVHLSYTATTDGVYVVSTTDANTWITVYSTHEKVDDEDTGTIQLFTVGNNSLSHDFSVEAGQTYLISVDAFSDYGENITFKIAEKAAVTHKVDIAVKLKDGSAAPAGITVSVINDDNEEITAVTDESGVAHFNLEDGSYKIQIRKFIMPDFQDNGPQDQELPSDLYTVTVAGEDTSTTVQYQEKAQAE